MGLYEHTFLVRQDATTAQVDALIEQYKGVLESNGAKIEKVENWGIKSLTYRIKKNRKAHMTLLNISGDYKADCRNGTPDVDFGRRHPLYDHRC